ncbi:hypothetical protein ACFQZZ_05130 [Nocardia sp. GCM10030253]|uniref:Rv1733c family protein n=1 Tax=Nocardia sp. GCM10030253 TaxID=3273404 RepID=UPI003638638B
MRRREDRLQSVAGALLLLLFLVIVPVATMTIGVRIYETETLVAQAEAAQLHEIDATVIEVGKTPLYAPVTPAKVTWSDPDGTTHTSDYQGTGIIKTGATVKIWLDSAGNVAHPPSETRALSKAVLITTGAVLAVLACCGSCYALLRRGLDRRRSRLWETEWATVGLTWGNHGTRPDQS